MQARVRKIASGACGEKIKRSDLVVREREAPLRKAVASSKPQVPLLGNCERKAPVVVSFRGWGRWNTARTP